RVEGRLASALPQMHVSPIISIVTRTLLSLNVRASSWSLLSSQLWILMNIPLSWSSSLSETSPIHAIPESSLSKFRMPSNTFFGSLIFHLQPISRFLSTDSLAEFLKLLFHFIFWPRCDAYHNAIDHSGQDSKVICLRICAGYLQINPLAEI